MKTDELIARLKRGDELCRREFYPDAGYWLHPGEETVRRDVAKRLRREGFVELAVSLPGGINRYRWRQT